MKVTLKLDNKMRIIGTDSSNHPTYFDTVPEFGGENSAPTPMAIMLQAMGACSFMDIVSILNKKRKQIDSLEIEISGIRADKHPKVFTNVHLKYILKSPDTEMKDLERAIELSQTTYCGASAMFQRAGCEVTTEAIIS
jgi:putative redox protein